MCEGILSHRIQLQAVSVRSPPSVGTLHIWDNQRNHTTFSNSSCNVCMPLVSDITTSSNIAAQVLGCQWAARVIGHATI